MLEQWQLILYALFLVDSVGAVLMSWFGRRWWLHTMGPLATYFPPAKGWSLLYLGLMLVIGYLLGVL